MTKIPNQNDLLRKSDHFFWAQIFSCPKAVTAVKFDLDEPLTKSKLLILDMYTAAAYTKNNVPSKLNLNVDEATGLYVISVVIISSLDCTWTKYCILM